MDRLPPSPLSLTHFLQPWSSKFSQGFDIFFDAFSNSLVLFKDGYFIVFKFYKIWLNYSCLFYLIIV